MRNSTKHPMRQPVAPAVLLLRARNLTLGLALVQLIHLAVFTNAGTADFVVWLLVHAIAQLALYLLRAPARGCDRYFELDWKKLALFLLLTLAFKMYSRVPYLHSWLTEGLYATRMNEELGAGGLSSIGSIFFYPLSILLAFCTMPRRVHRVLLAGVILICGIDLIALGTRNAPMFVLMFHVLAINARVNRRHLLAGCAAMVVMVAMFGYSTANRTSESVDDEFDWLVLFEFTTSTQVVTIDRKTVEPVAQAMPGALPAIFLTHYLSHSIGELRNMVESSDSLRMGGAYYLKYQLCSIGACDRDDALDALTWANPRPGVYQTFWASVLLDFGWAGGLALFTVLVGTVMTMQLLKPRHLGISTIVFTIMVCLSPIENYFYNALGLAQTLCIFLGYWILRVDLRALGAAPAARLDHPSPEPGPQAPRA